MGFRASGDQANTRIEQIGSAAPFDDLECRGRCREQRGKTRRRSDSVHDATCRDAERCSGAIAKSPDNRTCGDVRHIRSRREVQQEARYYEQGKVVHAVHRLAAGSG